MNNGKFIVVEGIDGCGKTTLCHNLVASFSEEKKTSVYFKFPVYDSESGKQIKNMLTGITQMDIEKFSELTIQNRLEAASQIRTWLSNGVNVICDRYFYSEVVYKTIRNNLPNVLDVLSEQIAKEKVGDLIPLPDKIIFINADIDVVHNNILKRGDKLEEYENRSMLHIASVVFNKIYSHLNYTRQNVSQIDATKVVMKTEREIIYEAYHCVID